MISYLIKLLILSVFSLIIIWFYYIGFPFHSESSTGTPNYIAVILFYYIAYKAYSIYKNPNKVILTPFKILILALIHFFILSFLFFIFSGWSGALVLCFKIVYYALLPIIIGFSSISIGQKMLSYIPKIDEESNIFKFLISFWLGFFIFNILLFISGTIWFYNIIWLLIILALIIGFSCQEFWALIKWFFTYEISIDNHDFDAREIHKKINLYLLSTEFLFVIITFIIWINLINIVRPMPIWWDDLWVYMNFPQLIASAGELLPLGAMYSWQLFTGIWYMFHSPAQAFSLNNFWWIASVLVIILAFSDLLKNPKYKTFINLPLLAATIFIAMPMVIFQQAKDMKLDPGLFFISSLVIYAVIYLFLKYIWYQKELISNKKDKKEKNTIESKEEKISSINILSEEVNKNSIKIFKYKFNDLGEKDLFKEKKYLILLFIVWILVWFAFSIKFTSLMLISAIIWVMFYVKLGFSGFLGYIAIYLAVFTKLWLWSYMNVVYPKDDITLINSFSIGAVIIWIFLLFYSSIKYSFKSILNLIIILIIFILWIWLSVSPWLAKNISEIWNGEVTIWKILNWSPNRVNIDYLNTYTPEELKEKNDSSIESRWLSESGTTINEDFWRYFGYEKGINNYIKLPWNLTMQKNQKWEYTDITYIFLALLPALFLFLAYSRKWFIAIVWIVLSAEILFFMTPYTRDLFTDILSKINLPMWYAHILLASLLPLIFFSYSLARDKASQIFRINMVFFSFYSFLWVIAAFGIVWYGIAMYFSLLLMIVLWWYYLCRYSSDDRAKIITFKLFGSFILLFLVSIYFLGSSIPHGLNNLKSASFDEYKSTNMSVETWIFTYHPDYLQVIFELNISDESKEKIYNEAINIFTDENSKNYLRNFTNNISDFDTALSNIEKSRLDNNDYILISKTIKAKQYIYSKALYPSKDIKNTKPIYRIWTFLKYFISDNDSRLYEDNLIFKYDNYIYDEDFSISSKRLKDIWLPYLLIDLWAPTIDRDPRHALTTRYENLMKSVTDENIELIYTNNVCLKLSLEKFSNSEKTKEDLDNFIKTWLVKHETYLDDWNVLTRGTKKLECYNLILDLIKTQQIDDDNYFYLIWVRDAIIKDTPDSQDEMISLINKYILDGNFALFKVK